MQDQRFANLMAVSTEFPAEDATKILGSLITIEDAKQNYDLKGWFFKSAMDGADAEIVKLMDEMGLEVANKDEIQAEKNTFQKIGKLVREVKSLEAKKAGATTGEKKELSEKINALTTQIAEMPKAHAKEIERINSEWQGKLTNSTIRSILASKKYANTNIPADVNIETAMVLLNKELEKKGAKIINTNTGLKLVQAKDETLDWSNAANEKPSVEQFFDGFLAENKLLAVNEPAGNHTPQGGYVPPPGNNQALPIYGNNGADAFNQSVVSSMDEDLARLEAAPK